MSFTLKTWTAGHWLLLVLIVLVADSIREPVFSPSSCLSCYIKGSWASSLFFLFLWKALGTRISLSHADAQYLYSLSHPLRFSSPPLIERRDRIHGGDPQAGQSFFPLLLLLSPISSLLLHLMPGRALRERSRREVAKEMLLASGITERGEQKGSKG